jgi:hypothetical protein
VGVFGRVEDDGYVCGGLGEGLGDCVSDACYQFWWTKGRLMIGEKLEWGDVEWTRVHAPSSLDLEGRRKMAVQPRSLGNDSRRVGNVKGVGTWTLSDIPRLPPVTMMVDPVKSTRGSAALENHPRWLTRDGHIDRYVYVELKKRIDRSITERSKKKKGVCINLAKADITLNLNRKVLPVT